MAEKAVFTPYVKKQLEVFPSNVQTLLLPGKHKSRVRKFRFSGTLSFAIIFKENLD